MLSILADVLMIATGHHSASRVDDHTGTKWNDRFLPHQIQDYDRAAYRFNPNRDLNW